MRLGARGSNPRFAVAWKPPPQVAVSVLRDILVDIGRTGAPLRCSLVVADLDPARSCLLGSIIPLHHARLASQCVRCMCPTSGDGEAVPGGTSAQRDGLLMTGAI